MYIYIYIYIKIIYVYIYIYIYIYIYRERERYDIHMCVYIYIYIYIQVRFWGGLPRRPRPEKKEAAQLGRGDDAVGNPRRARISQLELFEALLLLTSGDQFSMERFEPTGSQSTVSSPPLSSAGVEAGAGIQGWQRGAGQRGVRITAYCAEEMAHTRTDTCYNLHLEGTAVWTGLKMNADPTPFVPSPLCQLSKECLYSDSLRQGVQLRLCPPNGHCLPSNNTGILSTGETAHISN